MTLKLLTTLFSLFIVTILAACGTTDRRENNNISSGYGTIQSIDSAKRDPNNLIGTIAGAVVGGVVGSQIGAGRGKTVATIAGTAGGAVAGHEIQKRTSKSDDVKVSVNMDDGSYQTIVQDSDSGLRVGDRVKIDQGRVTRR